MVLVQFTVAYDQNERSGCTESVSETWWTYECVADFIKEHAQMPVIYKTYWLLHTLAVVIAIGITGSYFVVDYNPGKK
jgi:hypothetical protein